MQKEFIEKRATTDDTKADANTTNTILITAHTGQVNVLVVRIALNTK